MVTNYNDPSIMGPWGITAGPDGALWFANADDDRNSIGRITTAGTVTSYTSPAINHPSGITAGPDGALWFTNYSGNSIGRITTSGTVTSYTGPGISSPWGITAGPDGALWFTNNGNSTLGRITTSGTVTNYTGTGISEPAEITAGPDGALWFTNFGGGVNGAGSIGRITTSGTVTSYTGPGIYPWGITAGPDGALWFTGHGNSTLGRITTSGTFTIYSDLPSTTTLAAAPNPSSYGQQVTFTATVSPTDGGGTVAFSSDGNPISGCSSQTLSQVSGGSYEAACTTSSLSAGSHTITDTYSGNPTYAASGTSLTQGVGPTTTTVASSLNPSTYGQQVSFTATVSPTDGGGAVSFSADGNPISGCSTEQLTEVSGSYEVTCSSSSLAAGSHVISAAYSGDTSYGGSSGSVTQTVRIPTTTTVSSSANPASYGQQVTFTATVSPTDGQGTVSFSADGNPVSGCSAQSLSLVSGNYQATCTTSVLAVGRRRDITAAYSGDTSYAPSSGDDTVTVAQATPADAVTDSGPIALGGSVTFTATVSGPAGAAAPTGTVGWLVSGSAGATTCTGSTTTLSSGTATCTIDTTQVGTYVVSDTYKGDTNYTQASSNTDTVSVTPLATTTSLTSSLNPSTYGQPVTFTATVSPADGGGTVSFSADGQPVPGCSSQPLSMVSGNYQATCTTSALSGGSHAVAAAYSGDTNYGGSSAAISQAVNQKASVTTLRSGSDPSVYGQAVTFTATVSTNGVGTVSFTRGTGTSKIALCPDQHLTRIMRSYQARCTISSLAAGSYAIAATYSGDINYTGSAATVQQTVNKTPTTTAVSSSKNPSTYGHSVTFTAPVSPSDGTGTVTFWNAGNTITGCTSKPLQNNAGSYQATCTTSSLPGGTDKVKAVYSGDKNHFGSTGTVSQVVNRIPATTKPKSSPNPSTFGQTVKLTATISPTDGGGTVAFSANGHAITGCSSKALTGTGTSYQAVCKTSALPRGTDTVKAAYSGDAKYRASSGTMAQQVN